VRVSARGVGLDRLSVSFPVLEPDPAAFGTTSVHRTGDRLARTYSLVNRPPAGAAVFVGATEVPERGWIAKVEANPSRLVDPAGCGLLDVRDAGEAARELLGQAQDVAGLIPRCELGDARVKRVDVARDFAGVVSPGFFVRGLMNVKRAYARRVFLYANPQAGNAETLFAGSGTGGCRLYDQFEAYAERGAVAGSVRWEVEARGGWLDAVGLRTVADFDGDGDGVALLRLARQRWEWSRMGDTVTGTSDVVEAVDRLVCRCVRQAGGGRRECVCGRPLTGATADRLLGMMVRESLGVARRASNDSASQYEALKRRLGVVPSADLFGDAGGARVAARLDYKTGCEVAA
jgi:hypothetical protein